MIEIHESKTADTRTCDVLKVTKGRLRQSSFQHIEDVVSGLCFFMDRLRDAANFHDHDKLLDIDGFHRDFIEGADNFTQKDWYQKHLKENRHHLQDERGIPKDVNLVDVLEMIVDCVMAGMARSGEVYSMEVPDSLLRAAFDNTVELLKKNVAVVKEDED